MSKRRLGYGGAMALGLSAAGQRFLLVGLVAVIDLAMTIVAISPLRSLARKLADRPAFARLADGFDATVIGDVARHHWFGVQIALASLVIGVIAYVPVAWLLEGGVLGLLLETPDEARRGSLLARFGRAAGQNLSRMVAATLLALVPYASALILLGGGKLLGERVMRSTVNVHVYRMVNGVFLVPGLVALLLAFVCADMFRVRVALGLHPRPEQRSSLGPLIGVSLAIRETVRQTLRPRTWGTRLTYMVLWLATTVLGWLALRHLPRTGGWLFAGMLLPLLVIVARAAVGIGAYATLVGIAAEEAAGAAVGSGVAATNPGEPARSA